MPCAISLFILLFYRSNSSPAGSTPSLPPAPPPPYPLIPLLFLELYIDVHLWVVHLPPSSASLSLNADLLNDLVSFYDPITSTPSHPSILFQKYPISHKRKAGQPWWSAFKIGCLMFSLTPTHRSGYGAMKCSGSHSLQHIPYFCWDLGSCGTWRYCWKGHLSRAGWIRWVLMV